MFHDHVSARWYRPLRRTTDFAKGAHWLMASLAAIAISGLARVSFGDSPVLVRTWRVSIAFLACLAVSSAILHAIKLVVGRRRPRDELEHDLYGFRLFHYNPQNDSFPSGHAMTIFCVAVILCGVLPAFAAMWLVLAFYLALTRTVLNAHFLSDVFIGLAVGLIASRETVLFLFPDLARPWF